MLFTVVGLMDGGTSMFIRDDINFSVDVCESKQNIESICVTLNSFTLKRKPLIISSIYRSQKCNLDTFLPFWNELWF